MKVIIIGPAHPLRGGIANFNESLCRSMIEQGIDAQVVSFSLQYPSFLFPGTTQFDTGAPPFDIPIKAIINSINPFTWYKAINYIIKQKPDLVIVRFWLPFMAPSLGTIVRRVKKKLGIKIIAITDNVIPHEKRFGDKFLTNYFIKSCDGFLTLSKSVLTDLEKFTTNKNKLFVPHPIYDIFGNPVSKTIALQKLKLNPSFHYILFFGFIRQYKGLDLLLEAMATPQIKKLGIKLIIAGEFYESAEPYMKIIEQNNLQESVVLHTHYIDNDLVKYYFCASDIVVQPYHTATQSGVTQIAYHFEKPMIVTNVGGLGEMVTDGQTGYVTDRDKNQIANALVDYYLNQHEERMTINCSHEKKRFSWEAVIDGLMNLNLNKI